MGFKSARYKSWKTAKQTATYMGVSLTTVSCWENGRYLPTADKLMRLAEFYGCTIEELLTGNDKSVAQEESDKTDSKEAGA